MAVDLRRLFAGAVAGVLLALAVHGVVVLRWPGTYSHAAWRGNEQAAAQGWTRPFFDESPAALRDTEIVLVSVGLLTGLALRRGAFSCGAGLAAGATATMTVLRVARHPTSNLLPLVPPMMAFWIVPALTLGLLAGWGIRRVVG